MRADGAARKPGAPRLVAGSDALQTPRRRRDAAEHLGRWLRRRSAALAVAHLIERHTPVGGVLPRETQHPLADDVAGHLGGAAADGDVLPRQVSQARLQAFPDFAYHGGTS